MGFLLPMPFNPDMSAIPLLPVTGDVLSVRVRLPFIVAALPLVVAAVPPMITRHPTGVGAWGGRNSLGLGRRWGWWGHCDIGGLGGGRWT